MLSKEEGLSEGSGRTSNRCLFSLKEFDDEILLTGLSGRFPESDNLYEFEKNLLNGVDMVTDDDRRWTPGLHGVPKRSGKLKVLDRFDASFFGVHAKQAHTMDPQMRMLLELTHEAMMDAGVNPMTIRGSRTGVFIGVSSSESAETWTSDPDKVTGYEMTGTARAMFANRISFQFDLKGPSFAVDTACSSSFVALNEAVRSIRMGECDAAVVGGVNLCLNPMVALTFQRLGMLSPEGKCRSFDAGANGYVRSEGAVIIYIQRKSVEPRRSYATIVHVKTNADGSKAEGVTFPSSQMQEQLMKEVYEEAGIDPSTVAYVEAHGTGTRVGDPGELKAISNIFCNKNRSPSEPLLVGSVKSNMGHAEAASGLCSLAKIVVAIRNGVIPANLHFESPNPDIPALFDGRVQLVKENTFWNGGLVGVNSFGFGGANCHVILKSNPKILPNRLTSGDLETPLIVSLSGRSQDSVKVTLETLCQSEKDGGRVDHERIGLLHQIYGTEIIKGHSYRGYALVQGDSLVEMDIKKLDTLDQDGAIQRPPLWLIFSGMGSQSSMVKELMGFKIFEKSIKISAQLLLPKQIDLLKIINGGNSGFDEPIKNVVLAFVSIAAVQVGLIQLLKSLGLTPDGFSGHSIGELACAFCDGCFTAEQAVLAAYARGHAILSSNLPPGSMAAVGLSWDEAASRCPPTVFPACHNSKDSVTVAGPPTDVASFVCQLEGEGVFAKMVDSCGQAFHTPYIMEAGPKLRKYLKKIVALNPAQSRSTKWISTSVPESDWGSKMALTSGVDYHVNNLLSPVLFKQALDHVPLNATIVEVAPHCILQSILKMSLPSTCVTYGLLHKQSKYGNAAYFLKTIGNLYNHGHHPVIKNLYEQMDFPVSSRAAFLGPILKWDHSQSWDVVKCGQYQQAPEAGGGTIVEISAEDPGYEFLAGHVIDGRTIFPATGYLFLVWRRFAQLNDTEFDHQPAVFENVSIRRATMIPVKGSIKFVINIVVDSGDFNVQEGGQVTCMGQIRRPTDDELPSTMVEDAEEDFVHVQKYLPLTKDDVYKELGLRGYTYLGPEFNGIDTAHNEGHWGRLDWLDNWITFFDTILQFTVLGRHRRSIYLPTGVQKFVIDPQYFLAHLTTQNGQIDASGQNCCTVPLHYSLESEIALCPGIEFRGIQCSLAPKRLAAAQRPPQLEQYGFTPYMDIEQNHAKNDSMAIGMEAALRIFIDIITENGKGLKFHILEIASSSRTGGVVEEEPLSIFVRKIFTMEPNYDCTLTFLVKNEQQIDTTGFDDCGINLLIHDTKNGSSTVENMMQHDVVIVHDPSALDMVHNSLLPGGFLIYHHATTASGHAVDHPILDQVNNLRAKLNLNLAAHKRLSNDGHGHLFLMRKPETEEPDDRMTNQQPVVINVDQTNFDWVDTLKSVMKDAATSEVDLVSKIYLVSKNCQHSGIIGLTNCIRLEPGGHLVRAYCNFTDSSENTSFDLNFLEPTAHLRDLMTLDLLMNIFKDGRWGSYRSLPLKVHSDSVDTTLSQKICGVDQHCYVNVLTRGDLTTICWIQGPLQLDDGNTCRVHFAALNFRDIMLATANLPPDVLPPHLAGLDNLFGIEYSGTRISDGERLMGGAESGGLSTLVKPDPLFVSRVPDWWTLAQAATVPVAYSTAYYALIVRGKLTKGESLLVHSGASCVGQAAISIALSLGCKVLTTVGSREKRQYLQHRFPQLEDSNFANSRDTTFEPLIMKETDGHGVDVVLNSLAADKFSASLRCVATNGRFLEIGKADLAKNSKLGLSLFLRNITFHGVLLDFLLNPRLQNVGMLRDKQTVSKMMSEGVMAGVVQPMPTSIFRTDQVEPAFRFMAAGNHIGKVLIRVRENVGALAVADPGGGMLQMKEKDKKISVIPHTSFDPSKCYIILGGLGGFGLELAHWLIERGAKMLALVSRSGVTKGYQDFCLRRWREENGVTVETPTTDATCFKGACQLLQESAQSLGGPVGGIFNLAMVLNMDLMENQTADRFADVCKPKIDATLNLDKASRQFAPKLDHFVVFSSVISSRGSPGQASYGLANSAMERICERRYTDGLPALAVMWGAIGDTGILTELSRNGQKTIVRGTAPQKLVSCLETLDHFLMQSKPVVASFINWELEHVGGGGGNGGGGSGKKLAEGVAYILGLNDLSKINDDTKLSDLGIDSLMAVEVKQMLEKECDVILLHSQIRDLTMGKLRQLDAAATAPKTVQPASKQVTIEEDAEEKWPPLSTPKEQLYDHNQMSVTTELPPTPRMTNGGGVAEKKMGAVTMKNGTSSPSRQNIDREPGQVQDHLGQMSLLAKLRCCLLYGAHLLGFWFLFLILILNYPLRRLTKWYLKLRHGNDVKLMDRLTDAMWTVTPDLCNAVVNVKLEGRPSPKRFMSTFEEKVLNLETTLRLDGKEETKMYRPYDCFRWKVSRKNLFYPCWELQKDFNIQQHFIYEELTTSSSTDLDEAAKIATETYVSRSLDSNKPQWECRLLVDVQKSQFVLIFVYHHSYGDGISLANLLQFALSDGSEKSALIAANGQQEKNGHHHPTDEPDSSPIQLMKFAWQRSRVILQALHHAVMGPVKLIEAAPHCPTPMGPETRRSCRSARLEMAKFRRVRNHQTGRPFQFNAVLFWCIGKAYQKVYARAGRTKPTKLSALVPYAVFPYGRLSMVNNVMTLPVILDMVGGAGEHDGSREDVQERLKNFEKCLEQVNRPSLLRDMFWLTASAVSFMPWPILRLLHQGATRVPVSLMVGNLPVPPTETFTICGYKALDWIGFPPAWGGSQGLLNVLVRPEAVTLALTSDENPAGFLDEFLPFIGEELERLSVAQG